MPKIANNTQSVALMTAVLPLLVVAGMGLGRTAVHDSGGLSASLPAATGEKEHSVESSGFNAHGPLPVDDFADQVKPFVENWCSDCHWGDGAEAGIDLSRFETATDAARDLDTWKKVVDVVEAGRMPPEDYGRPEAETIKALRDWYLAAADADTTTAQIQPIRRLNRTEYENSVRDLLRLQDDLFDRPSNIVLTTDYFEPSTGKMPDYVLAMSHEFWSTRKPAELPGLSRLPGDSRVEHGFNNEGTALSISPLYIESCLGMATEVVTNRNFPRQSRLWRSLFLPRSDRHDEQLTQARQSLALFLERAFRRPVTADEVERYVTLYKLEREQSGYTPAMRTVIAAVLASPKFLFRQDVSATGEADITPSAWAMASRLSYFLWGTMPDDALFQAARENRLASDAEIREQVRRMMNDRRIRNLSTDFGRQWLRLDKVHSAHPDKDLFPGWHLATADSPGVSMMIEQLLLFETIMIEDRSIIEFIDADWAWLNRPLMDWYYLDAESLVGYAPPKDSFEDFFRVKLPTAHRGGIITSGAMLASTSATTRSSPVYRGAWVLDVVFNRPPPPPPPNVPALDGDGSPSKSISNPREKLAVHRENPVCASCHDQLDPIGFALEKFDAVGRFRHQYPDGSDVDATGELFGEPFDGAARFKAVILRQKERFVRGFVEHMMRYALGRELRATDAPEIERIVARVAQHDYRFRAVVEEVALSRLFRTPDPTRDTPLSDENTP